MTQRTLRAALATSTIILALVTPIARGDLPKFTGLGFPQGATNALVIALSRDGTTVSGSAWQSGSGTGSAFRWRNGTFETIGIPVGGPISANGEVIIGRHPAVNFIYDCERWSEQAGVQNIGAPPGWEPRHCEPNALSADGNTMVGFGFPTGANNPHQPRAFKWTASGGFSELAQSPAGFPNVNRAWDVSADGSVVVGNGNGSVGDIALRWNADGTVTNLGFLSDGSNSRANAVSDDGAVITGYSNGGGTGGIKAFRWTLQSGMVNLGGLNVGPGQYTEPKDISADGNTIVGLASTSLGTEAVYWTPVDGFRNLRSMLISDYQLDLSGWLLTQARGVSADGLTIIGVGMHNGIEESWIVHLPEPASLLLMSACGVVVVRRRRFGLKS